MKKEKLKEAFSRIKDDILNLGREIADVREELLKINQLMKRLDEDILKLKIEKIAGTQLRKPTEIPLRIPTYSSTDSSTHSQKTPTDSATSTQTSTHPWEIEGRKTPNLSISTGNQGVSTNKQTNKPTHQHISKIPEISSQTNSISSLVTTNQKKTIEEQKNVVTNQIQDKPLQQQISEASHILNSLDNIKKDIRKKFKRITKQEMLVFSTVYTLEEQEPEVDYRKIALKLNLSESSIRCYIQRMISKGIPIEKEKLNNKKIVLHIAPELKKIATLNTIIKLREI